MNGNDMDARINAVERLIKLFTLERHVYLAITGVSLLMLLFSAGFLIVRSQADTGVLSMMFGSSGLITYSLSRLLRMWDQALQVLLVKQEERKD